MADLRIVILSPWFGENMGYIENRLPPALGSLGLDVHVVTSQLQPHFDRPIYEEAYEPFNGPAVQALGTTHRGEFTLHRLPYRFMADQVILRGLRKKLRELQPSVVQTFAPVSAITAQAAAFRLPSRYLLYTGAHHTASTFPLTRRRTGDSSWRVLTRLKVFALGTVPGRILGLVTEKCHAVTIDCLEVAVRYYGVPKNRISLIPLGVDTKTFSPVADTQMAGLRDNYRAELGFADADVVCIYTGRLGADKNPLVLAEAIESLRNRGEPFRALFVGGGEQADAIRERDGSSIVPFVQLDDLPPYYRSADIGVWPREESTSMLDAAACGLPIVVSNAMHAVERYEGNGMTYSEGDHLDLATVLLNLKDPKLRQQLGGAGAQKMREEFDWKIHAARRIADYQEALANRSPVGKL